MEFNTFWMYNYFLLFLGNSLLKVYKSPFLKDTCLFALSNTD